MTQAVDQPLMGISARMRKSPFFDATRRWNNTVTTYSTASEPFCQRVCACTR